MITENLSFKKTEESIAYSLKLLQKCLRGAGEMLGDDYKEGSFLTKSTVIDMEVIEDASNFEDKVIKFFVFHFFYQLFFVTLSYVL